MSDPSIAAPAPGPRPPTLRHSCADALKRLIDEHAIPADAALMIHSSFRGLSQRGWRAEEVLEWLLDRLAAGTLLLPAMSWRLVTPDNPIFDEAATPSITGILGEVFRRRYATHRSLHPTHSVAGRGANADAILGAHHVDETPCSDLSPVGRLAAMRGYVMLLGVEMDSCTLVHHGEEKIAPERYLRPEVETYVCRRRDGTEIAMRTRRHRRLPRNFWQFEDMLAERGLVRRSMVNGVPCRSFPAKEMDQLVIDVLSRTPDGTIARPGQRSKMM
jgi:aminoglycoside 3-N-acetyltransferase